MTSHLLFCQTRRWDRNLSSLVAVGAELREQFAHFAGGVGVALVAGLVDAGAQGGARFVDAGLSDELLGGHEEGGDVGRVVAL